MSVINENYLKTGRKGILFMYDGDYKFTYSLEKAFVDTYDLLVQQPYIQHFKMWQNEEFDINLSSWYRSNLVLKTSWYHIFKNEYNVEWGKHKWINTKKNNFYHDKIIITYAPFLEYAQFTINLNDLLSKYDNKKIYLVGYSDSDKTNFTKKFGINLPFIKCYNIEDMALIINNCQLYIGTLSSPLVIAQATHNNTIALLDNGGDSIHNMLTDILPNYNIS
jgi:hypothetical protein